MDSLLATYASSDEEDEQSTQNQPIRSSQPVSKFGGNLFSALPPPSASLFSKLPQPRSDPFSVNPKPKKVVQFRPPVITKDDDEEEEEDNKTEILKNDNYVPQAPTVKSFLSSIPAPRNSGSLGAGLSSAGAGRRSVLEAQVSGLSNSTSNVGNESVDQNVTYENVAADHGSNEYSGYGAYQNVETDHSGYGPSAPTSYDEYQNYGQYESKWIDGVGGNLDPAIPEARKRGRNEIPAQVIEVNQDELMKNRPRPDQAKLTGIAFGPSYQPASSTKSKPSKLHKRKHQIGSLYFDMRSKEAELAERRSKGFLTKAETQAKYGW